MQKKHGMWNTRIYRIFKHMTQRCNNPKDKDYPHYGARGIKCLWKDFNEFKNDMYESYLDHVAEYGEKDTTIDRINFDGNYCKENCRWATVSEQNANKHFMHGNLPYEDGTQISITRFCKEHGISRKRMRYLSKKYNKSWMDIIKEMYIDADNPHPTLVSKNRIDKKLDIYEYDNNGYLLDDLVDKLKIENKPLFFQRLRFYQHDLDKTLKRWYPELVKEDVK